MSDSRSASTDFQSTALARMTIVEVYGSGAEQFLQGQISANVAHANDYYAPLGVFCTPKGRVIANAQLLRAEAERYWLLCTTSIAPLLYAHLKKYAVFFKAELSLREDLHISGVSGHPSVLAETLGIARLPTHAGEVVTAAEKWVLGAHGEHRWRLITPAALPSNQPESWWWQHEIRAGVAWLESDQSDVWLPQMINWEALGGISFKKGCYTGQEVVARAHYRGQVKKRLAYLELPPTAQVARGDSVQDLTRQRAIGSVIASERDASGTAVLAVISSADEPHELAINETPAHPQSLPYAVERVDPEALANQAVEDA